MVMEFAVGRASQKSSAAAFDALQPSRKWHWFSWWGYIGCMVLMMFYTTVAGWMLSFVVKMGTGAFNGLDSAGVGAVFNDMLGEPHRVGGLDARGHRAGLPCVQPGGCRRASSASRR